jgi:hypothetical protein
MINGSIVTVRLTLQSPSTRPRAAVYSIVTTAGRCSLPDPGSISRRAPLNGDCGTSRGPHQGSCPRWVILMCRRQSCFSSWRYPRRSKRGSSAWRCWLPRGQKPQKPRNGATEAFRAKLSDARSRKQATSKTQGPGNCIIREYSINSRALPSVEHFVSCHPDNIA